MNDSVDVLIIGGGLIGAALMVALADSGYRCLLVDAHPFADTPKEHFDARTLALSPAGVTILTMLNAWHKLAADAQAITSIHVSEQACFGTTRLNARNEGPLGYVIELTRVQNALKQLLNPAHILAPAQLLALDGNIATIQQGEKKQQIKTQLLVAADGINSTVRRLLDLPIKSKPYNQVALTANIGLRRSHRGCAYERFTPTGPLAMLPMTEQRAALVWCLPPAEAQRLSTIEDKVFLAHLQQTFGYKLGRFTKVGRRTTFPLSHATMPKPVQWPAVFVGSAVNNLHPVAGQGFNLGLRDVATLAQCIMQQGINPNMLQIYQTMRHDDQRAITQLTHGLVKLFTSQFPGVRLGRNLGLMLMDNSSWLKAALGHYARGYGGVVPDLVCNIPLTKEQL